MDPESPVLVVLNAGSSSLRAVAFNWERLQEIDRAELRWDEASGPNAAAHAEAAAELLRRSAWAARVRAVGHRVVHAGPAGLRGTAQFADEALRHAIAEHADLAPLHNPAALAVMAASDRILPAALPVAVLDTGFHATLPAHAQRLPVPWDWQERFGVRRFGFHGLSHAYSSRRAGEMLPRRDPRGLAVICCHLGAGCSLCACRGGRSIATTMGYTPLDGLMMATRSGSLDPGVVLSLLRRGLFDADRLQAALDQESGLRGVFGPSGDMRQILAARSRGEPRAAVAFDMYVSSLRQGIAAMAAELGGCDAVVFTGGVGEHAPAVREAAVGGLGWMGLRLDLAYNAAVSGDADISAEGSDPRVLVVAAREELVAAQLVRDLCEASGASPS